MTPPPIHLPAPPKRILVLKPSALGDIVHALPVLSLLRDRFPAASISWLVVPAFASLLQDHPHIDEVILFERKRYAGALRDPSAAGGIVSLARALRERSFDLAIDLQGLFRTGWLSLQTRAPVRVGFSYARELAWVGYTHTLDTPTRERHAIERYLDVAEALGCGRGPVRYEFGVTAADRDVVAAMLGTRDPIAVLLPGTNWPTKRWPADRFAALAAPLRERFGLTPVLAGGSDAKELSEAMGDLDGVIDLAGRTSLRQLVALLERASVVITNDSGPMHIAAALRRPMVALFGPTNPVRTGPHRMLGQVLRADIVCSPCYSRRCAHLSCLRSIGVQAVLEEVARRLATG
jgi:lipopolysaccharide heptosyltransferase I